MGIGHVGRTTVSVCGWLYACVVWLGRTPELGPAGDLRGADCAWLLGRRMDVPHPICPQFCIHSPDFGLLSIHGHARACTCTAAPSEAVSSLQDAAILATLLHLASCTQTDLIRRDAGSHRPAARSLRRVPPPGAVLHAHQQRAGQGCGTAHAAAHHGQASLLFQQPLLLHPLCGCWCALPHACDMLSQPQEELALTLKPDIRPTLGLWSAWIAQLPALIQSGMVAGLAGAWALKRHLRTPLPVRCACCRAGSMACKLIGSSFIAMHHISHADIHGVLRLLEYALGTDCGMYPAAVRLCPAVQSSSPKAGG